jgi:hypothetical protein
MAVRPSDVERFEASFVSALSSLEAPERAPLCDAMLDDEGAARALASGVDVVIARAFERGPDAEAPTTEGHGPLPREPRLVRLERGSSRVRLTSMIAPAPSEASARAVHVRAEDGGRPNDCLRCSARVELELDDGASCVVLERRGATRDAVVRAIAPVALALAKRLDLEPPAEALEEGAPPRGEPSSSAPSLSHDAARFVLSMEGPRLVLRDHASLGPRSGAGTNAVVAVVLGALALAMLALLVMHHDQLSVALGLGAGAALFGTFSYAFYGVARFAAAYEATSAPLLALGDGRVVVAPWVSRHGAIDLRPDGRFGAAVPVAEVGSCVVRTRDEGHVVILETDHGPFDLATPRDEATAKQLAACVDRAIDAMRKAGAKPTARQLARALA